MIGAPKVKAVDTSAAGDDFNAAFAVGLMTFASALEGARFASSATDICVTCAGAQQSLASRAEVEQAMAENTPLHNC
jgi:ribokinase